MIGRYVIQEVLGQGGFGITYLGIDKLYGNKVAIKEYYPQEIAMRKAQYEDVVTVTSIEEKNNYDKGKKRVPSLSHVPYVEPRSFIRTMAN